MARVTPEEELPADLLALRRFALLMDEAVAIPGTRRRVGLDAALGLVPGIGDLVAGLLSAWIVIGGLRHRVPLRILFRMLFNIIADMVIGAVPLLGDLFDFLFEENMINLRLLMQHRDRSRPPRTLAQIGGAAILVILIILAAALAVTAALVAVVIWIIGHRG